MASLGMGGTINGSAMSVPMGYLDFAPEPSAPTATLVTEHQDMNCPSGHDTRDLSNVQDAIHLDNQVGNQMHTQQQIPHQEILHQQQHQSHLLQHQQQLDQHPPVHVSSAQQPTQQQQYAIQQSHQSHHTIHGHVSITLGASGQHHPENIEAVATTVSDSMPPGKMEAITEVEHQPQQHHQVKIELDPTSEHGMVVAPEMSDIDHSDASEDSKDSKTPSGPKTWKAEDMQSALEALRTQNMSLTKASATYGIPSTTLWQRAHRLGIDTPKKEGPAKTWNEDSLNSALDALRTGTISANKASKAYGIPSSTLYKIARREGIRLAAPFNAAPTAWSAEDLDRALEAIRSGLSSVQKASAEFGIPSGTLYGRCKREGIELSRSNPTPWSEDAMMEALESVKQGNMSINQAAIHYNLPYSSLYGRFKRGKYENPKSANASNSNQGGAVGESSNGNVTTMAEATSSPQMEYRIEPHSENTQHYNPSLTPSYVQLPNQTQGIEPSQLPVNIQILNSNHQHQQLHSMPPPQLHQAVATSYHTTLHGGQPHLIQHHIMPQQHHIIYQKPPQQLQQQQQYHPMYHIIKQEDDRS